MTPETSLDDLELGRLDALWRAANYLSVGQIYVLERESARRAPGRLRSGPLPV